MGLKQPRGAEIAEREQAGLREDVHFCGNCSACANTCLKAHSKTSFFNSGWTSHQCELAGSQTFTSPFLQL